MSEVAVIGAPDEVAGFALVGARTYPVSDADQARAAWQQLPESVEVVILAGPAADAIADLRSDGAGPLTVRLPA